MVVFLNEICPILCFESQRPVNAVGFALDPCPLELSEYHHTWGQEGWGRKKLLPNSGHLICPGTDPSAVNPSLPVNIIIIVNRGSSPPPFNPHMEYIDCLLFIKSISSSSAEWIWEYLGRQGARVDWGDEDKAKSAHITFHSFGVEAALGG